jgi:TonB-like protein
LAAKILAGGKLDPVDITARNEGFFAPDLVQEAGVGARALPARDHTLSLAGSAILHGLALALIPLLAPQHGTETTGKGLGLVPVEVELDWNRASPAAKPTQAVHAPTGGAPEAPPLADALASKLEALAKLRAPGPDAPSEGDSSRAASMLPSSASSPGPAGMYGLKDFVLDQVERHWNLNLANLKDADYSVPVRVKITKTGEVLKAELVGDSRSGDPHYDEVAISARNAVLASSPLALPAGQYADVMDMVIYMNPRDTLR